MKKYIAKTDIAINVVLNNGVSKHISFIPKTGGGSVFYTDDQDVAEALERHYKFGRLFVSDCTGPTADGSKAKAETGGNTETIPEERRVKVVTVTDPDNAKDYLAEHFGISRTKIKTVAAIKEAGEAHGVEFKGI